MPLRQPLVAEGIQKLLAGEQRPIGRAQGRSRANVIPMIGDRRDLSFDYGCGLFFGQQVAWRGGETVHERAVSLVTGDKHGLSGHVSGAPRPCKHRS